MGRWTEAYSFFQSLGQRACPDNELLAALDDNNPIKLGVTNRRGREKEAGTESFWPEERYTERRLFQRIADEVRKRKLAGDEPIQTTYRKLCHLLGHFRFVGGRTMELLRSDVDQYLLHLVDYDSDVAEKRNAMLTALARLASQGNADIDDSASFLADHRLALCHSLPGRCSGSAPESIWSESLNGSATTPTKMCELLVPKAWPRTGPAASQCLWSLATAARESPGSSLL